MARPRKATGEGRSERLSGLRLTATERAYAETLAERSGCDLAELQRRSLLGLPIPPARDGGELAGLIVALNRVGNNLNQVAARLNAADEVALDARDVLADVKAAVALVAEAVG